jgi:hypothetical protein
LNRHFASALGSMSTVACGKSTHIQGLAIRKQTTSMDHPQSHTEDGDVKCVCDFVRLLHRKRCQWVTE